MENSLLGRQNEPAQKPVSMSWMFLQEGGRERADRVEPRGASLQISPGPVPDADKESDSSCGRVMRKREPRPTSVSMDKVPPCSWAIFWVTNRPKPVPEVPLVEKKPVAS